MSLIESQRDDLKGKGERKTGPIVTKRGQDSVQGILEIRDEENVCDISETYQKEHSRPIVALLPRSFSEKELLTNPWVATLLAETPDQTSSLSIRCPPSCVLHRELSKRRRYRLGRTHRFGGGWTVDSESAYSPKPKNCAKKLAQGIKFFIGIYEDSMTFQIHQG